MKLTSALLTAAAVLMSTNAFAGRVSLRTVSVQYQLEKVSQELPKSIQDQLVASNQKIQDDAVQAAIKKMEDICIDKNWPSANQLDITEFTNTKDSYHIGLYNINVKAICRSNN